MRSNLCQLSATLPHLHRVASKGQRSLRLLTAGGAGANGLLAGFRARIFSYLEVCEHTLELTCQVYCGTLDQRDTQAGAVAGRTVSTLVARQAAVGVQCRS